ncbi:MAG: hypothetical protein KDJ14_06160 [Xanthomonadales bacterium]|nr:hypothetical protein [Xanthomonadales bacterium]
MQQFHPAETPHVSAVLAAAVTLLGQCANDEGCPGQRKTAFECLRWLSRQGDLDPSLREACMDASVGLVRWQLKRRTSMREFLEGAG